MAIRELRNEAETREYVRGFSRKWKGIILHHSYRPTARQYAGIKTMEAIRTYHRSKGWTDIGYHLEVGPDGKLFTGRPLSQTGGHCLATLAGCLTGTGLTCPNAQTIGIMCCIDGDTEKPPAPMVATLRWTNKVLEECEGPLGHWEHRRFQPKSCPGRNLWGFNWKGGGEILTYDPNAPPSTWAKEAWEWAKTVGLVDGSSPQRPMTREEMIVVLYREEKRRQEEAKKSS